MFFWLLNAHLSFVCKPIHVLHSELFQMTFTFDTLHDLICIEHFSVNSKAMPATSLRKYKCRAPSCSYETHRIDNFNRHCQKHSNVRQMCKCGANLVPKSMDRHQKFTCPLRNEVFSSNTQQNKASANEIGAEAYVTSSEIVESAPDEENQLVVVNEVDSIEVAEQNSTLDQSSLDQPATDEIDVTIQTTIRIKTLPDGSLHIHQNPIRIGGVDFSIVPSEWLGDAQTHGIFQ